MSDTIADPVASYLGVLDDETEARFSTALNDWRGVMTPAQEAELEPLITERQLRP